MGKSYRPYYPDEELLLPPSLRDWLPEDHLAYFVSDVVDNLDLSAMDAVYGTEKRGQPPYDPLMMTKVLVYGYCIGVFSSRRIEREGWSKTYRSGYWRRTITRTFGQSLISARSICKRWRGCSSRY
jgi:hypothetical protein